MADQGCFSQVQPFKQFRQVVSVGIHVVASPRLAGPAMSATIMSNASIAVGGQEDHLRLPGVRVERPAMTEDDGLARAPVLVVDLCAVTGCNRAHANALFRCCRATHKCSQVWLLRRGNLMPITPCRKLEPAPSPAARMRTLALASS